MGRIEQYLKSFLGRTAQSGTKADRQEAKALLERIGAVEFAEPVAAPVPPKKGARK